jgi:hypothetical protein
MEGSERREIWFLNRNILVVRPGEPFIEWVRSTDDGGAVTPEFVRNSTNAFLLPEFDDEEEALDWIRESCEVVFELMLSDWIITPDLWPEDRGWPVFQRWFSFEHIETAWDLVDGPLSSDPPLPDPDGGVWDA